MPQSINTILVGDTSDPNSYKNSINRAATLGDLLDLIPAPFRPRMQIVVNKVYKAAIKSNHARSYLMTLERHQVEGTFPPEIGGRVHTPALQISKEFDAAAEWKIFKQQMDTKTSTHKAALLDTAIRVKKSEVTFLQGLFAEHTYSVECNAIQKEILTELASDSSVSLAEDGSVPINDLPEWIKNDAKAFDKLKLMFPQRAIALAFTSVQSETAKKFKSLSLKRKIDTDVEMQDVSSQSQTVDMLVTKRMEQLLKEYNLPKQSKISFESFVQNKILTSPSRQEGKTQFSPEEIVSSQKQSQESSRRRGKGKTKEAKEEISREVSKLDRAFLSVVQAHLRVSTCGGLESGLRTALGSPVSDLRRRDRVVVSTHEAYLFLEKHPDLFCGVSAAARRVFVAKHTPVSLFELGHDAENGVFKGPGVVLLPSVEYKLALNTKFILHHSPNALKVHQAWPQLERSVRIRWHFRHSERTPSKFYVPRKDWMPPPELWNPVIERGLAAGKDLLFNLAADLNPLDAHRSNPDLRLLRSQLQSSSLLVKITDKNLGVAVLSKDWYTSQCHAMLADMSTYDSVDLDDVSWYREEALKRINTIAQRGNFPPSTSEYLLASHEESAIPEFHAIPKVHKIPWKLRPIVPSHSWCSRRASEVCDYALRECVKRRFPWVVDSTKDVINNVSLKTVSRQDRIWIVTGDVEAFYTNVNVSETIQTIRSKPHGFSALDGYEREDIADLLDVVMNVNCFGFGQEYYHQIAGIAMGTACAPAFANLNLAFKEDGISEILGSVMNNKSGLILYNRYIDDILLIFKGPKTDLQSLLSKFNKSFEPFKIGWNINPVTAPTPFLDIEFFFEQGFGPVGIQSRVYRKRFNKHQYIPWSSAHPESVKKAFIKAELTRFMIISSQKQLFEERVVEFMQALARRGYPGNILTPWLKQVQYEERQAALSKRKPPGFKGLPLMLPSTYDEIWEYIDLHSVFQRMIIEWAYVDEFFLESLRGPLIKSLRRTDNLFDKFSGWNKAVLRALQPLGSDPLGSSDYDLPTRTR
jgi:hypothetical protein